MTLVLLAAATLAGAAQSLTPAGSAPRTAGADGFLQRWLILEPIQVPGQLGDAAVQALVKKEHFPTQFTAMPRDGEKVTVGTGELTWHAVDTAGYNVNLFHFARGFGKPTSNVLFWVVTTVHSPQELRNVRLAIGSNAASVWWLDGEEVIGLYNDRQTVIDDGVSKRVTLRKGATVVRGAIVNAGGATDFCVRFLDGDDRPIRQLTVDLRR
jgi:hypothetical protein